MKVPDLKKPPKFIFHPWLVWVELGLLIGLLILLYAAVRGAGLGEPELTRVPEARQNLDPLPEPDPNPVARMNQEGEIIIDEEISIENWETFTNDTYHFSLRYPAAGPDAWFVESFKDYTVIVPPGDIGRIEINTVNVGGASVLDRVGIEDPKEGFVTEGDQFSDRAANQYRCIACSQGKRFARHIRITDLRGTNWGSKNEIWYDFTIGSGETQLQALGLVALFDRILSTFVLDNAYNAERWLTYENIDAGFSIRHPQSWGFREAIAGEGTDFIVAFGPDIPQIGRGLRVYLRGTGDTQQGVRRLCGDFAYDLVRDPGSGSETDVMISSFRCR